MSRLYSKEFLWQEDRNLIAKVPQLSRLVCAAAEHLTNRL